MARLFDNLLKVLRARSVYTGTTLVSLEVDFELPRGFIAKIAFIVMSITNYEEDIEADSVDRSVRAKMALMRDPDDITTVEIPVNNVSHDVIMDFTFGFEQTSGTAGDPLRYWSETVRVLHFDQEGLDVITARNMRFNIDGFGVGAAILTESLATCDIYYTLEKITSSEILNLLDIL